MSFINKLIPSKKVIIIDIGSYKVKLALCEIKNREIKVLNVESTRQEPSDMIAWEVWDIFWVWETIKKWISKLLKWYNYNPKDVIINIPTLNIVSSADKIIYSRVNHEEEIDIKELDKIISKVEKKALEKAKKDISKNTGFFDVDMKLITSSITQVSIDCYRVTNPIWFTWKEVSISTLNIFIPNSRYNLIHKIVNHIDKNIKSILPSEFCIPKLFEKTNYAYSDIIFFDIWDTKTTIIIQKNWSIIWFNSTNIWINDLIKNIKKNHNKTKLDILEKINDENMYIDEKKEFLNVLKESLIVQISEIIKDGIIPSNFFFLWWWSNDFIKKYILNIDYLSFWINHTQKLSEINITEIKNIDFNWFEILKQSPYILLLSMIVTTNEIINIQNNPIQDILRNFIEKNEF